MWNNALKSKKTNKNPDMDEFRGVYPDMDGFRGVY